MDLFIIVDAFISGRNAFARPKRTLCLQRISQIASLLQVFLLTLPFNGQTRQYALDYDVDWRHLIHIMADDWYAHHTEDDYEINLRMNNSWPDLDIDLYPYGRTGYE